MSERGVTSHDEPVNQEGRQPALDKGGPEVILSVIDDATSISDVQRLVGGRNSRTSERILVTPGAAPAGRPQALPR